MKVFENLLANLETQRANYLVLIDPDTKNDKRLPHLVEAANKADVDAILVGGSLIMDGGFDDRIKEIKSLTDVPIILFPGASSQLSSHADALLFMSLLSGRNPQYLIGEQVQAAPMIHHMDLEAIPTAYLLMDGGSPTAVEFMSGSKPLPMNKPDIALAHGLAAQFLGMSLIYLEAGSGAAQPVPNEVIALLGKQLNIPLMVGGGIRTPELAAEKVRAGARFIVTGTIMEEGGSADLMQAFARAVHQG